MMKLEVVHTPARAEEKGRILFVPGACHGAWCWKDFVVPFADEGYDCYAMSFRGHGNSEGRDDLDTFGLDDYADDVAQVVGQIGGKPIVVAHSLGGMVLENYLGKHPASLSAAVLLNAMPPDGTPLSYQMKLLMKHRKGTAVMLDVNKGVRVPVSRLKDAIIFSGRLSESDVAPYVDLIQPESKRASRDQAKPATDNFDVATPVAVVGSRGDWMFPDQSKNAQAYGTEAVMLDDVCHDAMLDPAWETVAQTILRILG